MKLLRPVLAIVAAVFLFAIYQWDVNRVERGRLLTIQNQQVLFHDTGQVVGLTFINKEGTFSVERADDKPDSWMLTKPAHARANNAIINSYVENMRGAKRQAEYAVKNPSQYGFDKSTLQVAVKLKNEKGGIEEKTLLFGSQPVPYGPVYTMIEGDARGFTVSEWFYRQSLKNFDQLRDRSIIPDDLSQATKYLIEQKGGVSFELQRENASSQDWFVMRQGSKSIPADRSLLDRQLVGLGQGTFVSIEDHPTTSTLDLGLDSPTLKIFAQDKLLIELGNPLPEKEQLIARNSEGTIGIVAGGQFVNFLRPPIEWGTKKFIWMKPELIQQIETSSGNSSMTLLLNDKKWVFADMPGVPIHQLRLQDFFTGLMTLSAQQIVKEKITTEDWEKYGIVENGFHLRVTGSDGLTQGLRFGITDSKAGFTYVLREQDDSLWKVDVRTQNAVFKFRSDLEDRRLFIDVATKTTRVEVQVGKDVVVFEKTPSAWKSTLPNLPPVVLPGALMNQFLNSFEELEDQSQMLGTKKAPALESFRFYDDPAQKPFLVVDLLNLPSPSKDSVLMAYEGKVVEIPSGMWKSVDDVMTKIAIESKTSVEKLQQQQQQNP